MFEVLLNSSKLSHFVLKLVALASLSLTAHSAFAASDRVTVAWDPNPEPDISEYQVYYGVVNSGVTNVISAGTNTEQDVSGLQSETDYWFFVTAKNTVGLESDPSTVLFYTTAPAPIAPTITSAELPTNATVGTAYSYSVTATGDPTITFSATGLPSGLAIASNGTISGTLSAVGPFNGVIMASNGTQPDAVQPFSIVVYPAEAFPPTITSSAPPAAATIGSVYGHVVTATGDSTITFSATGLPPGLSITSNGTVSGTPSESGTFNGVITAANGTLPNASQFFSIFVYPAEVVPPTITSTSPPSTATVGSVYGHVVTATGDSTITFSATGLPPGLSIASSGTISGTPSESGTFNGVITAANGTLPNASQFFSIFVYPEAVPPTITSSAPPGTATVGSSYGHVVTATGDPTITFGATDLPPGLSIALSGTISGTPSESGAFSGVITASNGTQPDATQVISIVVSPAAVAPTITSSPPPETANVGSVYSHTVSATGDPTILFSATGLPSGLAVASNGIISGTPLATGTFNGVITASNGTQPDATQAFSIVVSPVAAVPPTITSAAPPAAATVGVPYSYTVTATGDPTIAFEAFGLPVGLAIGSNGTISGTPSTAGTFNGLITASNGTQPDATLLFSIVVSPGTLVAPTITSATLPAAATVGVPYSYTVTATGDPTITFGAFGLPPGILISPQGLISGTPTTTGTYSGEITASNGAEPSSTQPFNITVSLAAAAPTITSAPPPAEGVVGTPYGHTVTAVGTAPVTFSTVGLPPGLSISPQGSISGTPTTTGAYSGEITASNGTEPNSTQPFTITIRSTPVAPLITSAPPPREATMGVAYSHTVTATGTSPMSFSASGLPPGLSISPSGTLSGTPIEAGWYNGLIRAANPVDTRLQLITIIVSPPDAGDPPVVYFEGDRIVLIPATIHPKAEVSDDKLSPEELTITWTQTSGPVVAINDADQLVPSMAINEEGIYRFHITVQDGANTSGAEFQLHAYRKSENIPSGTVIPNIQSVQNSFDGLILGWDSQPGKTYIIGQKEDLNDPSWLIIAQGISSVGSTTYWPDDRVRTSESGFYGIFQID